jgi:hypothetical protein
MQILEIRALPRSAGLFLAGVVNQRVDLDDVGAPVGELPNGGRSGANAG